MNFRISYFFQHKSIEDYLCYFLDIFFFIYWKMRGEFTLENFKQKIRNKLK